MRNGIQYIKNWLLTGILILAMGVSSSYALSSSSMLLDTVPGDQVSLTNLASIAARSKKQTKKLLEENDKTINNVKVFYNPVAEQVSVSFKLSKTSHVSIKVMDALGNEVMNLLNDDLDDGVQSLSFDTDGKLSVGFYFVRVTSGSEAVIKRISIR